MAGAKTEAPSPLALAARVSSESGRSAVAEERSRAPSK